jgi:FkbM family methyltransferase
VWELSASEIIWRLIDKDDTVVDVGANIGYMTLLMKSRAHSGRVLAFEPHPVLFEQLASNLRSNAGGICEVIIHRLALSDREGDGTLYEPSNFDANSGTASLLQTAHSNPGIHCKIARLDDVFPDTHVKLLKVDVEGNELAVFHGAAAALREGRIAHVVFEDHEGIDSAACKFLRSNGYSIFRIDRNFLGPVLSNSNIGRRGESPNFLATLQPQIALSACKPRGWRVLHLNKRKEA